MRSWASDTLLGTSRRQLAVRIVLAVGLLGAVLWALPTRRAGEEEGHHGEHAPPLDTFEQAGVTELTEGQRGPVFTLQTLDGRTVTLEEHAGAVVILNFWATWCQPCTVEMPALEALWREYRERGLVVLGVSEDRGAPRALIEPYVRNLGLTFPILLDPDVATGQAWRVTALPATFLIRPGGEVAAMALGAREWNSAPMRALIETLLPGHARHGR